MDPGAVHTLEYLHRGDTAIVTMQHSYLPSWLTILVDPNRSRVSAEILFDKIYGERGPDVSPYLQWYPILTFPQVGCDLPTVVSMPTGYGHNISPSNYIDGWIAVTAPEDWGPGDTERLKQLLAD